jgi:hypothetical protein
MRVKDVFSVFPRKLRSGKVVFYYQCYDESGNRSSGLSPAPTFTHFFRYNHQYMTIAIDGGFLSLNQETLPANNFFKTLAIKSID